MIEEKVKTTMRLKHYSRKTETAYLGWIKRFIDFYKVYKIEQPSLSKEEYIETYLSTMATYCSYSTQNQALQALLFLYKDVYKVQINRLGFTTAKKSNHIPAVFSHNEAMKIISNLTGDYKLLALLMYGSGLRLNESLSLRVKDIDFDNKAIWVRQAKGAKDRKAFLPESIIHLLKIQVSKAGILLNEDLYNNFAGTTMDEGLKRKYPHACKELAWQYLFPQPHYVDRMRHPHHESKMQRALRNALISSKIAKHGSCHTLRHSFATEYLRRGGNIKQLQILLGHSSLRSTMIYSHIVDLPENNISPLDEREFGNLEILAA